MPVYEKSCGAVVFTKNGDGIAYVIVQSLEGYYGFPKGHCEENETEVETALREVFEETGLRVSIKPGFRCVDEHSIPGKSDVIKKVVYFLAEYDHQEIHYQKEELLNAYLFSYSDAFNAFQWDNLRVILRQANDYIKELMEKNHV